MKRVVQTMTKTELMEKCENARIISRRQLRHCQAYIEMREDRETGELFYTLRSYQTVVAGLFDFPNGETWCVVLDYWSATTAQHIAKFINDTRADHVVNLYLRSDRVVYHSRFWNYTEKYNKESISRAYGCDYSNIIEEYLGW